MAGSLIKIDEEIVTSAVASVTLTGIDSTYDVYMVKINNLVPDGAAHIIGRFTESGIENSTANYDMASKRLRTDTTFNDFALTNRTDFYREYFMGSYLNTNAPMNATFYIFNANNSSEYTFITWENTGLYSGGSLLLGNQGGGVFTVASAVDGFKWTAVTNNIASGHFVLYGLKK
jgi:hypothetical protein